MKITIEEFKRNLKKCKDWREVYFFLEKFNKDYGYGITAKNADIPYEDIIFTTTGIKCAFYLTGGRTYKTIGGFANGLRFWNDGRGKHEFGLIVEDKSLVTGNPGE